MLCSILSILNTILQHFANVFVIIVQHLEPYFRPHGITFENTLVTPLFQMMSSGKNLIKHVK